LPSRTHNWTQCATIWITQPVLHIRLMECNPIFQRVPNPHGAPTLEGEVRCDFSVLSWDTPLFVAVQEI
jgi:hypothetical protein